MKKATRGPWWDAPDHKCRTAHRVIPVYGPDGIRVCEVQIIPSSKRDWDEHAANAALIARAPEMLALVERAAAGDVNLEDDAKALLEVLERRN